MKLSLDPTNLVVRATVVFLFVLLLLRISGKRQLGQMGATEFVAILLISNAVQNAMNGGDNSLLGGLILAVVLIFLSWAISMLTYRSRLMRSLFEGSPTLLIHQGKVLQRNMEKERLTLAELKARIREQGVDHFSDVQTAILESDGHISVLKVEEVEKDTLPSKLV